MANYTRTAIKGAVMFFSMSIVAGFMGYLVRLVFARGMSRADYGLFYAVFTFFAMLSLFRDMGLGQALIKFIAEYSIRWQHRYLKGLILITFLSQFVFSIIISYIVMLLSNRLALDFFHAPDAATVIILLGIMFILMPFEKVFSFVFQGFKRFDYNSMIESARMCLVLGFSVLAFRHNVSVTVPCLAYILAYIIEIFIYAPLFRRTFPKFFAVKAALTKDLFRKLFFFGLPVMVGLVGSLIITYADTLTITYFRSLEEVALYQVAMPTAKLLLYFTTAVSTIVLPLTSELWARKLKQKLVAGVEALYKYSFVVVIPLAFLMLSFPTLIIKVFFGQKYIEASSVLQILAIANIIYTICFINSNVLSGIGRPKENAKIILAASLFNLAGNIILVPPMGIVGASIATLLSYVLMLFMTNMKIRQALDIHTPWLLWAKNLFAGLVFIGIIYILKSMINIFGDVTEMIVVSAISFGLYLLLIIMLRVIDMKEVRGILRYALKK